MSQINIIQTPVFIRKLVNTLVGSKPLFTCTGNGEIISFIAVKRNLFYKKIIPTTGSHSLIIDLSNIVF